MLLVGGMLLTGTSVSALARGIGRGVRATSRTVFHGGDAAARTVARSHADWREQRQTRVARPRPSPAPTDVMSTYPETDEFEPTVRPGARTTTPSTRRSSATPRTEAETADRRAEDSTAARTRS